MNRELSAGTLLRRESDARIPFVASTPNLRILLLALMMLVLFDIDDTLIDHSAAMQSAATVLHRDLGLKAPLLAFLVDWDRSHERHYARFLSGEISCDDMR